VGQSICRRPQNHSFGQAGAATPDHQEVGLVDLDYCQEPAHRVSEFFDSLVIDTLEIQMGLDVAQDLLLALDDCG